MANVAIQLSDSKQTFVPSNRYLADLDEHWYETNHFPLYKFNEDDIETFKVWLASHYILNAKFIYEDGTEIVWEKYPEKIETPIENDDLQFDWSGIDDI